MNDEQIFELAEKCGFQDDFGYWNFKDEGLLDFVFLVQNAEREAENMHRNVDSVNMSEKHVHKSDKFIHEREWVGLTDADIAKAMHGSVEGSNMLPYQFARAIEAKLKEKNT